MRPPVPKPGKVKTPKAPLNPGTMKGGLKGGMKSKLAMKGRGPVGPQKDFLA